MTTALQVLTFIASLPRYLRSRDSTLQTKQPRGSFAPEQVQPQSPCSYFSIGKTESHDCKSDRVHSTISASDRVSSASSARVTGSVRRNRRMRPLTLGGRSQMASIMKQASQSAGKDFADNPIPAGGKPGGIDPKAGIRQHMILDVTSALCGAVARARGINVCSLSFTGALRQRCTRPRKWEALAVGRHRGTLYVPR